MSRVRVLRPAALDEALQARLADVLIDCVEGGASVSFMSPLDHAQALAFWRDVAAGLARGERSVAVAFDGDDVVGTAQVVFAQPPNQPHRADVAKMLVTRRARRGGVGAALLASVEEAARAAGKTLLVLDTASDDARRLYERSGWQRVGDIPDYALLPHGGLCSTTYYFKRLG